MKYQQIGGGSYFPYPQNDIDPAKKNAEWCMQYARAAYYDWSIVYPKGMFANNGGNYDKFRMYALGKQPIGQYKKLLGVDAVTDQTWLSVDWSVRSIISGYRDKAISRLVKDERRIVATPVDSQSKTELDNTYAAIKAKLIVRELAAFIIPACANAPVTAIHPIPVTA